jgi:hypothetical protein
MITKTKKININKMKNKINIKEINLKENKMQINSRSTANINSPYNYRLNSESNKNEYRSKITLTSYNVKIIKNATYRTLKERKKIYPNSEDNKKSKYEKIKFKNQKGKINIDINEINNHFGNINSNFSKININNDSLSTTPNSVFNNNSKEHSSKICYDIESPDIQNYSFKNLQIYKKLDELYNESKSMKNNFKPKNVNNDCNRSKIIQIKKDENTNKIKLNYKNKKEMREKLIPKQKNCIKDIIIISNKNELDNKINLLNNEESEDKNQKNIILKNYKLYRDNSFKNSNKKNIKLDPNNPIKIKPKLSHGNAKIIGNLNEKTNKINGNINNNNLYNHKQVGDDHYIVKSNENLLRNKKTLETIYYFDNCNSKLLNHKNFNKYYKNLLSNAKKPINFICNNIVIRDKATSIKKENYLKNQPSL